MAGAALRRQVPVAGSDHLREGWGEVLVECSVVLEKKLGTISLPELVKRWLDTKSIE